MTFNSLIGSWTSNEIPKTYEKQSAENVFLKPYS
jgi:hypothetical protein